MKLKEFFGTRNLWLVLLCLILAILGGLEFDRQAQQAAENPAEISVQE